MRTTASVRTALLAASGLGLGVGQTALAQNTPTAKDDTNSISEIIVTARRVEERMQDVPISMTVLTEDDIVKNNLQSAKDIATYTPGLTTNNRYGSDNTTWTIRGFTQEQRTTATVGTYFGDVVAPRGSGATQGGDGAGPGALFDLQNIQVLKGPQGTLFGRNSTGGAVILVPRKPTHDFDGFVEASAGDYGMYRAQGVLNAPVSENFRLRFGVDHSKRDGYLENVGLIGDGPNGKDMGSVDYVAGRISAVADITSNLENYTIATYSNSKSTGVIPKITKCFTSNPYTGATASSGAAACAQIVREESHGFWSVSNPQIDNGSETKQWQVINTTSWLATDTLTVKNILSYAEFRGKTNLDLFGLYRPIVTAGTETSGLDVQPFNTTAALPGHYTNAQSSFVEELQLQGRSEDSRWIWQGGLYLELNDPLGISGILSTTQTPCQDIATFDCVYGQNSSSIGRLGYQTHKNEFKGKAAYFQTSYDLTDQVKLTGGIRYTEDTMKSDFSVVAVRLYNSPPPSGYQAGAWIYCANDVTFGTASSASNPFLPLSELSDACHESRKVKTSAPTWLLGLDFKPIDDVLLYAKWSRGYRQGGVAPFAADRLQVYDEEKVDTYEIGAKVTWQAMIPGYFNIAAFDNDFTDQQLQIGLSCNPVSACAQTTAIINAGESRLRGIELEAGFQPIDSVKFDIAYAYLNTEIKKIADVSELVSSLGLPFNDIRPLPVGSAIPNAMPHKVTAKGSFVLPVPDTLGKVTFDATYVYQSKYRAVSDPFLLEAVSTTAQPVRPFQYGSKYGVLPSSNLVNLNLSFEGIAGSPIDASAFVTNATNEKVYLHANVQAAQGFVSNIIGEPRMYGFRLRYKFGG